MKDREDMKLEALFRSGTIRDDGFSERVVRRIRRRVWIRRWTLPIAMAIGGLIAAKPAMELMSLLPVVLDLVPEPIREMPAEWLPQLPLVVSALAAGGAMIFFVRLLED